MNFEEKVIKTLKDDNGNEIKQGDSVVYTTKSKPQSIIAKFDGMKKGYMLFFPASYTDTPYTVQPRTIDTIYKVNTSNLFTLE